MSKSLTCEFFFARSSELAALVFNSTLRLPRRTMTKFFLRSFSWFVRPPPWPSCWNLTSVRPSRMRFIFSIFVNAPLLELADVNKTPNPSKAPWYFLGLQELLALFHPMVAGVLLPGIGMGGLMLAPYIDRNPSQKPEDRKFAVALFTVFLMSCAVLTMIGSFFRGPGQLFIFPWTSGLFFEL